MAHPESVVEAGEPAMVGFHTAEMVRARNAANPRRWPRYEAVYGELLVTPAPGWDHQRIVGELFAALHAYLAREPVGIVMLAPADITWGRRDTSVQPDVFVTPTDILRLPSRDRVWASIRHLRLAAEVVSPGSRRADFFTKRTLYQKRRVERYWVIDPDQRLAEVWTPDAELPQVERERLVWHPGEAREPFTFDLAARFAELDAT